MKPDDLPLDSKTFRLVDRRLEVINHKKTPDFLYKYSSINDKNVKNFNEAKIHFSNPFLLNDIMEGSSQFWRLDEFIDEWQIKTGWSSSKVEYQIKTDVPEKFFADRGLLCLTERFDNNLFWPHYTSELGFCIEFFTEHFVKSLDCEDVLLFPMDYGKLKRINFKKYTEVFYNKEKQPTFNALIPMAYTISLKDSIWSYEQEWRILITNKNLGKISHPLNFIDDKDYNGERNDLPNRNLTYNRNSISRIIISTLFFSNSRFSKELKFGKDTIRYDYRKIDNDLIRFLQTIKKEYSDKIYQIDRDIREDEVVSIVNYKIEIKEVNRQYIIIRRILLAH